MRWCIEDDILVDTGFESLSNPRDGISVDRSNPLCPNLVLDEKERKRLIEPFKLTLIKVMGRTPSLRFLEPKIQQMWAKAGAVSVVNIKKDFFLVEFHNEVIMRWRSLGVHGLCPIAIWR